MAFFFKDYYSLGYNIKNQEIKINLFDSNHISIAGNTDINKSDIVIDLIKNDDSYLQKNYQYFIYASKKQIDNPYRFQLENINNIHHFDNDIDTFIETIKKEYNTRLSMHQTTYRPTPLFIVIEDFDIFLNNYYYFEDTLDLLFRDSQITNLRLIITLNNINDNKFIQYKNRFNIRMLLCGSTYSIDDKEDYLSTNKLPYEMDNSYSYLYNEETVDIIRLKIAGRDRSFYKRFLDYLELPNYILYAQYLSIEDEYRYYFSEDYYTKYNEQISTYSSTVLGILILKEIDEYSRHVLYKEEHSIYISDDINCADEDNLEPPYLQQAFKALKEEDYKIVYDIKKSIISKIKNSIFLFEFNFIDDFERNKLINFIQSNKLEAFIKHYIREYNDACYYQGKEKYIESISIRNLYGKQSLRYYFPRDNDLNIIYGVNGIGKTTIFNLIDSTFISGNDEDNKRKMKYLMEEVKFDSFSVYFNDGTGVFLSKENNKLTIHYNEKRCFSNYRDFEDIKITEYDKEQNHYLYAAKKHFKNIQRLFPTISKENQFLFVKINRTTDGKEFGKYIREELLKEMYKYDRMKSMDTVSRVLEDNDYIEKLYNQYKVPVVEVSLKNDIDQQVDLIYQCYLELKKGYYQDKPVEIPLALYDKIQRIIKHKFTNEKFLKMEVIGLELWTCFDETDINFEPYNYFVKELYRYFYLFEKYLLMKVRFESFYGDYALNKKRLIMQKDGKLAIKNKDNSAMSIDHLSSGEINVLTVLYNVIFKTTLNSIVLIDEPEISLHIAWQEMFSESLLNIIHYKKQMQVITASHSPFISSGHSELLVSANDDFEDDNDRR